MNKQALSLGRVAVMVSFALSCFGLLLFLWLAFGGAVPLQPKGYRFHTSFGEATQLAKEADVRISGVSVGKVKEIVADGKTGRSDATIELEARFAPLPSDSRAVLRQKTLLGETYVELTPGSPKAPPIPEEGDLKASRVSETVELDEIFRSFDKPTRAAFQSWMGNLAITTEGRGQDLNDTIGTLTPFAQDTNKLLKVLQSQSSAVRRLSRNTGEVFTALSERKGQLAGAITNGNRVFDVTARRNQELQETFIALPAFQREAKATIERLTRFAQNTDPLITQLRPAARQLSPTLTDLSALAPDLKALFRDLNPVIDASVKGLPATEKFLDELTPALGATDPVLRQLNPILTYVGLYKEELNAFFANVVASTQATSTPAGSSKKLHYLRTTNPFNLENLAMYNNRLGSNRSNPYQMPGAFKDIAKGLPVFDDRNCGRGNIPSLAPEQTLATLVPANIAKSLTGLFGSVGGAAVQTAAPPCRKQGKFDFGGELTQFPHVNAARDGSSGSASR